MMYLVYHGNEYYGFSYSKNVAKILAKIDHQYRFIPTSHPSPEKECFSDEYHITFYSIPDKDGKIHDIVATEHEFHTISNWMMNLIADTIMIPAMDIITQDGFDQLPTKIRNTLSGYIETVHWHYWNTIDMPECSYFDTSMVTYEAYLFYHNRDRWKGGLML